MVIDRREIALISLYNRLKLEVKFPELARSNAGRYTMYTAKKWLGPEAKTRKRALKLVEEALGSSSSPNT